MNFFRPILGIVSIALIYYFFSTESSFVGAPYASSVIQPGQGILELRIDESGYADVVSELGKPARTRQGDVRSPKRTDRNGTYRQSLALTYPDLGLIVEIGATLTAEQFADVPASERLFMARDFGVLRWIKTAYIYKHDKSRNLSVFTSEFTGQTSTGLKLYDTLEKLLDTHGEPDRTRKAHTSKMYYYQSGLAVQVKNFRKGKHAVGDGRSGKLISNIIVTAPFTDEQLGVKTYRLPLY